MSFMMNRRKSLPLLLLLQFLVVNSQLIPSSDPFTNHTTALPAECLRGQASALLRLKRSFTTTNYSTVTFRSWRLGTDCCRWEGISCSGTTTTGRVTSLDLGDRSLESPHLDAALFELTSLRRLNLAGNDFRMSEIPPTGLERLTRLTHLNLSTTNFSGQVPRSVGRLTNLVSLDLSFRFEPSLGPFHVDRKFHADLTRRRQLTLPNLPALLADMGSLRELHLGFVDLSSKGNDEWCTALARYTPNLRVLSMPFCELHGNICAPFAGLRSLSVIDLQHNRLSGPFPEFIAGFSSLSVLQLNYNDLHGWVPPAIFQHKRLVTIDLHQIPGVSGTLPNFSAGSNLQNLLIGNTNFSGAIPSSVGDLKSLKKLGLGAQGFAGDLPSTIGGLKSLSSLEVSGLEVVGPMPPWITNLTSLEVVEFSHCGLHGPISSSICELSKLRILSLHTCSFSGKIPPCIFNLSQLDTLLLHSNNFSGQVELSSLWRLPSLSYLKLSNNKLNVVDGEDNSPLLSFPDIKFLELASCNISNFPNVLKRLNGIYVLDLSNNQIHGVVPQWAWETWTHSHLFYLNLSHNMFTSVGYDIFLPLGFIDVLDLSFNMFDGPIPIPKSSGSVLDYSSNRFSFMPHNISTQLEETVIFKASRNQLSGNIPPYFCGTKIQFLDLSYNILIGSIPSCLMADANALKVLNLKGNQLLGKLPHDINKHCMLEAIDFTDNLIQGELPRSLASCKNLEVLDIGNNQINDYFPCWMSALPGLQVLVLNNNKFFGQVAPFVAKDKGTCEFQSLRILDLSSNNFSGALPGDFFIKLKSMMVNFITANGALVMEYKVDLQRLHQEYQVATSLTYKGNSITFAKIVRTFVLIDVSNNVLHGSIPDTIGELVLLNGLNMSHNSLRQPIPSQLGRLKQLESLDLSSNELTGVIPQGLAYLDFLATLNLSDNNLEGRIPGSPHFLTFLNSSFARNDGLCGPPLSKNCSNATTPNTVCCPSKDKPADVMIFLFAGLGFGIGFAVAIIVTWVLPLRKNS